MEGRADLDEKSCVFSFFLIFFLLIQFLFVANNISGEHCCHHSDIEGFGANIRLFAYSPPLSTNHKCQKTW